MTKDDGEGIFDGLGYKLKSGKVGTRKQAQAEADQEMREEAGLDIPDYPKEEAPKQEAPAPKKFKFAGKEFDTQEAAEQSHKSLEGMFKPLHERVSKAEALAQEAAESARYGRKQVEERQAQEQQQQQESQPVTQSTAQDELSAVLQNVDGEMFETLARERGLPLAGRYLAAQVLASVHDHVLPALREEILGQIMPQLQPIQQSAEFQQQTETVGNLLESVSQLKNPDGQIAFPELNDATEAAEIGELWETMDGASATPQSLIQAIAMYRLYRGARGGSPQVQPQVTVTEPQNTLPRSQPLEQGGFSARPTAPRAGAATADSRFSQELDNADLVDRTLGFAIRRRR